MINSKDTKIVKELVTSALGQVTNMKEAFNISSIVEKAFDLVIKEMEQGKI